jgi:hypothetical protein
MAENQLTFTVTPQIDYDRLAAAVAERLVSQSGMDRWLSTKQAQKYTGHSSTDFFKSFVESHSIPVHRDGKTNFYDRFDLDKAMQSL